MHLETTEKLLELWNLSTKDMKILGGKKKREEIMYTSIFSVFRNVFKSCLLHCCLNSRLCGKGLRYIKSIFSFSPQCFQKLFSLTLSQTTNFRLFLTIDENDRKVLQTSRKHWVKEKLLIINNFSFSHSVF